MMFLAAYNCTPPAVYGGNGPKPQAETAAARAPPTRHELRFRRGIVFFNYR